jgi:hypothetical protein
MMLGAAALKHAARLEAVAKRLCLTAATPSIMETKSGRDEETDPTEPRNQLCYEAGSEGSDRLRRRLFRADTDVISTPRLAIALHRVQRWSAKLGQADKWNFCLRAARMPRIRRA